MSSTETRLPEDLLLNPDEAIERAIDRLEACSGEKSLRAEAQDISIATLAPKP